MNVWDKLWSTLDKVEIDQMTKIIFRRIEREISFEGKSILELGCGTGKISYMAYKHGANKLTLVDSSKEALKLANKLFQGIDIVEFVNADILELDQKMKYDIVLSSGVVEHFQGENLLKCVDAHRSFCKDKIIIVVPASPHYNNIRCKQAYNRRLYGWQQPLSKRRMAEIFEQLSIPILCNKRFCTLYGIPGRGQRIFNPLLRPIDSLTGGLLLTIGEVPK